MDTWFSSFHSQGRVGQLSELDVLFLNYTSVTVSVLGEGQGGNAGTKLGDALGGIMGSLGSCPFICKPRALSFGVVTTAAGDGTNDRCCAGIPRNTVGRTTKSLLYHTAADAIQAGERVVLSYAIV